MRPPASVPLLGLLPSDSVTFSDASTTVLPPESTTRTATAGAMAAPAWAVLGWVTNSSPAGAGPAATSNERVGELYTPAVPMNRAYAWPALFTLRSAKLATPAAAVTTLVPDSLPFGFPPSSDADSGSDDWVARLSYR